MNANAKVRMLVGCSILVAVCHTSAFAGGTGGMGASHLGAGGFSGVGASHPGTSISHVSVPSSALKVPFKTLPSSPTGPKFPGSGISPNNKLKLPPGLNVGKPILPPPSGGSTPPSGGSTPPGSGTTSPTKDHDHFPYWLWFTPAFYGNSYGNWGYPSAPAYSQVSFSSPVVVEQAPVTPVPSDTTPAGKLTMKLGQSYTVDNTNFGEQAGELSLSISGLTLPVRLDNWTAQEISFTLPSIGLVKATDSVFQISNADHQLAQAVAVTVVPAR